MARSPQVTGHPIGPTKARFEIIFSSGLVVRGAHLKVISAAGTGFVGVTTAKKIGCHSRRNRVKRRIRELVRLVADRKARRDYVIVVSHQGSQQPFEKLSQELLALFEQVNKRWEEA